MKLEKNIDDSIFEEILRKVSLKAFKGLIACGVRDLKGFIRLTEDDFKCVVKSKKIINEIFTLKKNKSKISIFKK